MDDLRLVPPVSLLKTLDGSYLFRGLSQSPYSSIDGINGIAKLPLEEQEELLWRSVYYAHENWRSEKNVFEMITSEECATSLYAFVRLELAGIVMFNAWIEKFKIVLGPAFAGFGKGTPSGQSFFLKNVFKKNRRHFAEQKLSADVGDVYRYVCDPDEDILGVRNGKPRQDMPEKAALLYNMLYRDLRSSFSFRIARQIILAAGGQPPLLW